MLYEMYNWPSTTIIQKLYEIKKRMSVNSKNSSILIACYPRSASNYLNYLLAELLQFRSRNFKLASGIYHDLIYLPKVIDVRSRKTVVTQHLRLTSLTRSIIKDLNIKPIVLVRNIFDVVISYNDYIYKRGYGPLDPDKEDLVPEFCKEYFNFSLEKQINYLIDTVIPWYITFYVSWYHYTIIKNDIQAFWLTYEDLTSNTKNTLKKLFNFYGVSVADSLIDTILSKNKRVNYNKGVVGRGHVLAQSQKDRIVDIASYYPDVDFKMIGLYPESKFA